MKKLLALFSMLSLFIFPSFAYAASSSVIPTITLPQDSHIQADLQPVNDSGVSGFVDLFQRPFDNGTHIFLIGFGLTKGNNYISLYYDNHQCNLEPYSASDIVGTYTGSFAGLGITHSNVTDNLDEINSVSIREAGTFKLLACADVHP